MAVDLRVSDPKDWTAGAAGVIWEQMPDFGTVVLTGGGAAERLYPHLIDERKGFSWSAISVFFSDERCVPPTDEASNYRMVRRSLLEHVEVRSDHRMRGEDDPEEAARSYDKEVRTHAPDGFDLTILGLGPDGHIASLFPGTEALGSRRIAEWVWRTDGLKGITLTPPALLASRRIVVIVEGEGKAQALRRFLKGEEPISQCPARLLLTHPNLTVLSDTGAASAL